MNTICAYSSNITEDWQTPVDYHYIYFADIYFNNENYIKIGMTNDVEKRMYNFNFHPFSEPKLLFKIRVDNRFHAQSLEKFFHEKFSFCHARRECFVKSPEIMLFIESVLNGQT